MAQLTVDLNDAASVAMALTILASLGNEVVVDVNNIDAGQIEDVDDLLMGGDGTDMDSLLDEPEPEPELTLKDVQNAFRAMAKAKGKDAAVGLVKKALAKMGIEKMEEIPDEKREAFIKVLTAASKK
jgi:hypothetical protein